MAAERIRRYDFVIRTDDGQVVAWVWHEAHTRPSGVNQIEVKLDPEHNHLSAYLIHDLLHKTVTLSPGHRVEIIVPTWMEAMTKAVENAGFTRRLGGLRMGLIL